MTGPADRGELGFSLVESVVAIAILGLVVGAMVGGMATSITASDIHRQQAEVNAVMVSAAETVKASSYVACATTYGAGDARGWPAGAVAVKVQYWDVQRLSWDDLPCHDRDGTNLFPMQKVSITVTNPGGRASATVEIVKRGP